MLRPSALSGRSAQSFVPGRNELQRARERLLLARGGGAGRRGLRRPACAGAARRAGPRFPGGQAVSHLPFTLDKIDRIYRELPDGDLPDTRRPAVSGIAVATATPRAPGRRIRGTP